MAAYFARAALQRCAQVAGVAATSVATATYCDAALNKKDFTALVVARNDTIGKNVHKVTLAFPDPSDTLGMTCAGMLMVEGEKRDGSGVIARPYTPVSRDNTVGRMELVVKDYPGVGNVSSDICAKKVGDTVRVKGCFTKIKIEANKWKRVGLVAGGSGLTPCLQVVEELLSLPEDKTQIDLIFCNKDEGDIYLKDHLDALAASSSESPVPAVPVEVVTVPVPMAVPRAAKANSTPRRTGDQPYPHDDLDMASPPLPPPPPPPTPPPPPPPSPPPGTLHPA